MSYMMEEESNCSNQSLLFEPDTLSYNFAKYIFPIIFAVGVVGNVLNIIIFQRLRTKSNLFLLIIAVADLCFFIPTFFLNLTVYDSLATSQKFLHVYFNANAVMVALGNWFSTASIW